MKHDITDPNAPLGYQCGDPACREHGTAACIITESSGSRAALNPTGPCVTGTQVRGTGLMDVPPATQPPLPEPLLPDGLLKVADELEAVADRHMPDPIIAASLRVDAGWVRRGAAALTPIPSPAPTDCTCNFCMTGERDGLGHDDGPTPGQPRLIELPPVDDNNHCTGCGARVGRSGTCKCRVWVHRDVMS